MKQVRVWLALIFVICLAVAFSAYYVVHKPIALPQAMALAAACSDLGVAALLTLLGGTIGRWLLKNLPERALAVINQSLHSGRLAPLAAKLNPAYFQIDLSGLAPGERITVQAAFGFGVMGLVMLGLGLAGLYYSALLWPVTLIALLLLWREARGWLTDLYYALHGLFLPDRFSKLAAVFVIFTLGLGLLRALAPPLKWDALVYHLTLPKLYTQTHSLQVPPDILFTGMPQQTEMLYTAALLLRGETAAQTLGWVFGALLALGLAAHAQETLGARFAAVAPAVLFSSFTVASLLAWAYAELLLMLFALAVLMTLRQWRLSQSTHWLGVAGVLAGMAVGCKYTGLLVPIAGAAVVLYISLAARPSPIRVLRVTLYFSIFTLIAFSPWLIKNWLFTGNPVYPLLFPAGQMDALRQWFYNRPDLTERNPLWAGLLLIRATFLGMQGARLQGQAGYEASLGPLFVCLLLGLALGWHGLKQPTRRELWPAVIFALTGYAVWAGMTFVSTYATQTRLFLPLFTILAVLCAGGLAALDELNTPKFHLTTIVNAALVFVLGLSAFENLTTFLYHSPLPYLLGAQSAATYRQENLGWYAIAIDQVNALPAGSRVVFLWEARSLECVSADRCLPDVVIDRWWHLRRTVGAAEKILTRWQAEGITHLLIYDAGANNVRTEPDNAFSAADWSELDALRQRLHRIENPGGAYSLYELP